MLGFAGLRERAKLLPGRPLRLQIAVTGRISSWRRAAAAPYTAKATDQHDARLRAGPVDRAVARSGLAGIPAKRKRDSRRRTRRCSRWTWTTSLASRPSGRRAARRRSSALACPCATRRAARRFCGGARAGRRKRRSRCGPPRKARRDRSGRFNVADGAARASASKRAEPCRAARRPASSSSALTPTLRRRLRARV